MESFRNEATGELLPVLLWKGTQYRELREATRSMTDSDELAWEVFAEVIGSLLLRENVTGYPLGTEENDDAPDADENIPWPFTEEDELRHRRLLLLRAEQRIQTRLTVLEGQMELFDL